MTKKYKDFPAAVVEKSLEKKNQSARGFSLIEVMATMAIFLIVIAAVYQVLRVSLIQRNTVSTRIDAVKSARIALNYIRRDAVNAGLSYHNIGGLTPDGFVNRLVNTTGADTDADDRDMLTGIVCGDNVSTNSLNTGTNMDSIGFVTRDLNFNAGNFISITGTSVSGSDVIVATGAGQAAAANPYDLYLLETGTTQVVGLVTAVPTTASVRLGFGAGVDPLNVNQSATASGGNRSLLVGTGITGSLKKINLVTYGISADGVLVRKSYGNNTGQPASQQIQTRELIYNVQDFQVRYLMDDGTTTTDPSAGNNGRLNQQKMNQVIQMEVTITVRQNNTDLVTLAPITVKEVISARNLRYTIN